MAEKLINFFSASFKVCVFGLSKKCGSETSKICY